MENKKYVYLGIRDFYEEYQTNTLGIDLFKVEEEYEEQVSQTLKEAIHFWNTYNLSIFTLEEILKDPSYENNKLIDLNNNVLGIIGQDNFEELDKESFVYAEDTIIFLDVDLIEGYEGLIHLINTMLEKRNLIEHCERNIYIKKIFLY